MIDSVVKELTEGRAGGPGKGADKAQYLVQKLLRGLFKEA